MSLLELFLSLDEFFFFFFQTLERSFVRPSTRRSYHLSAIFVPSTFLSLFLSLVDAGVKENTRELKGRRGWARNLRYVNRTRGFNTYLVRTYPRETRIHRAGGGTEPSCWPTISTGAKSTSSWYDQIKFRFLLRDVSNWNSKIFTFDESMVKVLNFFFFLFVYIFF